MLDKNSYIDRIISSGDSILLKAELESIERIIGEILDRIRYIEGKNTPREIILMDYAKKIGQSEILDFLSQRPMHFPEKDNENELSRLRNELEKIHKIRNYVLEGLKIIEGHN